MNGSNSAIVLDLSSLPEQARLSRPTLESLAIAATVTLDRLQPRRDRDPASIAIDERTLPAEIVRVALDANGRATYDDPQEATEEGAEAVAILAARRLLDRIVFRRLPKGTGADYRMRSLHAANDDMYERLECSGIGEGGSSTRQRLREKIAQLATYPLLPSGHAVVTNFGTQPIEIAVGSFHR